MLPRANTSDYGLLLCVYMILSFSVISAPLPSLGPEGRTDAVSRRQGY